MKTKCRTFKFETFNEVFAHLSINRSSSALFARAVHDSATEEKQVQRVIAKMPVAMKEVYTEAEADAIFLALMGEADDA